MRREAEGRVLEEEKKLQRMILDIEEEKKIQKEMQQELLMKEKEISEKQRFYQEFRDTEEKIISEERNKFEEFRAALRDELDKVGEVRERVNEAKLAQFEQQRHEMLQNHTQELRRNLQSQNMMGYLDEIHRGSETQGGRSSTHPRGTYQSTPNRGPIASQNNHTTSDYETSTTNNDNGVRSSNNFQESSLEEEKSSNQSKVFLF